MSDTQQSDRSSFVVAGYYRREMGDNQEWLCAQGHHEQPLVEGRCEYCGTFDCED